MCTYKKTHLHDGKKKKTYTIKRAHIKIKYRPNDGPAIDCGSNISLYKPCTVS